MICKSEIRMYLYKECDVMGFLKKPEEGDEPKPKKTKPPSNKSVFDLTVIARVQGLLTASSGVIRVPKAPEGSRGGSGYVQGLLNASPKKPELKVLAIKRGDDDTTVSVIIMTPNGEVKNEFTTRNVLTEHNAMATGKSIAKLLKDPRAARMCGEELIKLAKGPSGMQKAFRLDTRQRLMIESGEGR